MRSARTVHIDIVDYPGEWLLDLALLDTSYADWSAQSLGRLSERSEAANFLDLVKGLEAGGRFTEPTAQALARSYTDYLTNARAAGYSDCTPGRFLLPGDLAGSPVLSFAPLPVPEARMPRGSLYHEMQRRYEAYKARVVKPFFRDHFARIDRQVVLVDALGAIHNGPRALEDLRQSMTDILAAFRPGRNAFLTRLMRGQRVEKILFAATKSDHLHHSQHPQLSAIVQALVRQARDRADFSGAQTHALALASLRTTTEARLSHEGREVDCVQGILLNEGKRAAFYPGALPEDPAQLLAPARQGASEWLDQDYAVMRFAPASLSLRPGEGPPHIRLDRAVQFLIGDRL
jgi:predicted YcjX-like family ATPase